MDRDLVTRIVLAAAFIVAFLVASQAGFYVNVVGPVAVLGIAAVMFWPRHDDEGDEADEATETGGQTEVDEPARSS